MGAIDYIKDNSSQILGYTFLIVLIILVVTPFVTDNTDLYSSLTPSQDTVCGDSPLKLEGQTFSDKQELKDFLSDKELSYEKAEQNWNPFVKDGQLYIKPEGDVCEK